MANVLHARIAANIIECTEKSDRPIELPDPYEYISQVNVHIGRLLTLISQIPDTTPWDVVTPELFARRTASLDAKGKLGALWLDFANQGLAYSALAAWKARSLIQSVVRSINASELLSPGVLSRSLLELATATLVQVREAIGVFEEVASSDAPVLINEQQLKRIEETLERAIWGSRIGTSKISEKIPLWSKTPYPQGAAGVTSVLTAFQKIAKEQPEIGATAFRVYEWLCDLAHPSTQGLRVFWDSYVEVTPGLSRIILKEGGAADQTFIQSLVLWATGYSAVMLFNALDRLGRSITGVNEKLASVYGLPRSAPFKGLSRTDGGNGTNN